MQRVWRQTLFGSLTAIAFLHQSEVPLTGQSVVLNEVMASNGRTLADEDGDTPDWIELYNPSPTRVDLSGYGLSERRSEPFRWVFTRIVLDPHRFLVVFASGKNRQPELTPPLN